MSGYTPTTDEVRDDYASYQVRAQSPDTIADFAEGRAEFARWLADHVAEVERAAAEKAWDECKAATDTEAEHIWNGHPVPEGATCDECSVQNPYRKEQEDD